MVTTSGLCGDRIAPPVSGLAYLNGRTARFRTASGQPAMPCAVNPVLSTHHYSSRKIRDIIGVIDGIAFQANIVALNPAVEAARAGFTEAADLQWAASEGRSLAWRSAEAGRTGGPEAVGGVGQPLADGRSPRAAASWSLKRRFHSLAGSELEAHSHVFARRS